MYMFFNLLLVVWEPRAQEACCLKIPVCSLATWRPRSNARPESAGTKAGKVTGKMCYTFFVAVLVGLELPISKCVGFGVW